MGREMRRKRQALDMETCERILREGKTGILSVITTDGTPYGVPLNYYYEKGKIYFHSALDGEKVDAIRKNPQVSFTIIQEDLVVPEELTTYFRSVIAFGRAVIIEDEEEKEKSLKSFALKYAPDFEEKIDAEIKREFDRTLMVRIDLEKISGKEAIELVRKRP